MKCVRRLISLTLAAALGLLISGCASPIQVQVQDPAALKTHDIVFLSIDNAWVSTHSVVGLLQQELARRGYGVKRGTPPEELKSRSLILELEHAGERQVPGEGRIDELRHLEFQLIESSTGRTVATAEYHDDDLDIIEQKVMLSELMDRLLGEG